VRIDGNVMSKVARAVVALPMSSNPGYIVKSLYWINESRYRNAIQRIAYKVISTTYKFLQFSSPR